MTKSPLNRPKQRTEDSGSYHSKVVTNMLTTVQFDASEKPELRTQKRL